MNMIISPISTSNRPVVEYASPRTISLQEGELPPISIELRGQIEGFLKGTAPLGELNINKQNYKEVLQAIKVIDLEFDRLSRQDKIAKGFVQSSYFLRTLCLQASEGELCSYEAYTKSINAQYFQDQFGSVEREYASHEYNYIPERVRDHLKAVQSFGIEMLALSKRLNLEQRTFTCVAGNCGVGKSRSTKTDEMFSPGLIDGELKGSSSVDIIKGMLRKDLPRVTNQQIHTEGVIIGRRVAFELYNRALDCSVVIDEPLGTVESIQPIHQIAVQTGAKIRYKDIDGPLLISCLRVLGRDIQTEPPVSFQPVAHVYTKLRTARNDVIKMTLEDSTFETYQLYVADSRGNQTLAAEKCQGIFHIIHPELYQEAVRVPTFDEIEQVKNTEITDQFIQRATLFAGVNVQAIAQYKGMTIEAAMAAHSHKLPEFQARIAPL